MSGSVTRDNVYNGYISGANTGIYVKRGLYLHFYWRGVGGRMRWEALEAKSPGSSWELEIEGAYFNPYISKIIMSAAEICKKENKKEKGH